MSAAKCYFCGRTFQTKNALRAHLQFCMERKKQRDWWIRYPVAGDRFRGNICVVSRSPKTLDLVAATHRKLLDGAITPAGGVNVVIPPFSAWTESRDELTELWVSIFNG